ncbi:MAG: hypothetical protein QOE06_1438 [Thermoleophilaceae bacterium]|nr:hypothetical protein [Thermoleophilaceae bacterium]
MTGDAPFRDPGVHDGERTAYRGIIDGRVVGGGELRVEAAPERYVQRVSAELEEGYVLDLEMSFARVNGTLRAEHYRLESHDGGRPVALEEGWFRGVRGLHWGGAIQGYPANMTPLLGGALALRGLEFTRGERHRFALWLANTVWWELEAHVEKREQVDVPAGSFDAWRVRVVPRFDAIGATLNRVVAAVLPPFRAHFDAGGTHRLLRFSFPTGPFPWNPRGLIEATERL